MNTDTFLLYCVISFFYIISPGPSVLLAITNGITTNMKVVAISSVGNVIGILFLSTVSILGLGTILVSSSLLFMTVKIIGAIYLIYLGGKQFFSSKKISLPSNIEHCQQRPLPRYFYESLLLAATNPKPILFFIALFPQFLNIDQPIAPQFLILTGVFMLFSFTTLCCYGYIAKIARKFLSKQTVMQWFHQITGGIFILLGLGLLKLKNHHN